MSEPNRPEEEDAPRQHEEEELDEFDHVDPLKREPLPGLDPVVPPVPPES
jgi:hypothetical protein